MNKKELSTMKNKSLNELNKEAASLKDKLWELKVDLASGKVKNVREIKMIKKTIAQILTLKHGKN